MTGLPDFSATVKICPVCNKTFYSNSEICLKCQRETIERTKLPQGKHVSLEVKDALKGGIK